MITISNKHNHSNRTCSQASLWNDRFFWPGILTSAVFSSSSSYQMLVFNMLLVLLLLFFELLESFDILPESSQTFDVRHFTSKAFACLDTRWWWLRWTMLPCLVCCLAGWKRWCRRLISLVVVTYSWRLQKTSSNQRRKTATKSRAAAAQHKLHACISIF